MSKKIQYFFLIIFLFFCFVFGLFINLINNPNLINFSILEYKPNKPSILLDDEGNEWARFELDKRENVSFDQFPEHLIQAFLASEDRDFFNHSGISFKGILRSIFVNLRYGKVIQGASTITQQLIKLLFFDSRKTFKRKIKEQFLAIVVENQYSKEQILENYLNYVYFGCGIYGVETASQRFFGKKIQQISVSEAALLAAVVKSPASYCPLLCPLSAQKRRNLILNMMHDLKFIDDNVFEKSIKEELLIKNQPKKLAQHLKEAIRLFLEETIGAHKLYYAGLKIQTTINKDIQKVAEEKFTKNFEKIRKEVKESCDGAFICMDNKTGEIKALIGGVDFGVSKLNRAFSRRQIGSIFKPILYSYALQNGYKFTDTEFDEPITINLQNQIWTPKNYSDSFEGEMTLAKALSFSNNIIAIKLILKLGCKEIADFASKFKFSSPLLPYPSLALGCIDAPLKEALGAFNVFSNNGIYVEPHFIKWVKDEHDKKIYKANINCEKILDTFISDQVAKVLTIGIKRYISRIDKNKGMKCEAIGKSGTTNDSRTCWFIGSTPNYTTGIYIGCDNNESMGKNIFGSRTAFPIWYDFNEQINQKISRFNYCPLLKEKLINWNNGKAAKEFDDQSDVVSILIS